MEDRTSENTRLYAEAVKEVGKEAGVPVVDAWSAITKAAAKENDGLDKFLADGLHLTADGYEVVTEGELLRHFFVIMLMTGLGSSVVDLLPLCRGQEHDRCGAPRVALGYAEAAVSALDRHR